MNKFYYDLHVHSCLSPCGDDDNTPNNIAGMASLCGLDIVALTDHNTTKNCPAFFEAAKKYGIIPVAGIELTTSEDIHVVCLFPTLDEAMGFDKFIESKRILIKNRPNIFGQQTILDSEDNPIGTDEYLLSNATAISVEEVHGAVSEFGGICYPAHVDRESNGIIAVLGAIPADAKFTRFELHDGAKLEQICAAHGLCADDAIISSDAHYLTDIRDKDSFFVLNADRHDADAVRRELFELLGR